MLDVVKHSMFYPKKLEAAFLFLIESVFDVHQPLTHVTHLFTQVTVQFWVQVT